MAERSEENICCASDEIAATEKRLYRLTKVLFYCSISILYHTVLSFLVRGNICVMIAKKTVNSIFCEGTCTLRETSVFWKLPFEMGCETSSSFRLLLDHCIKCKWDLSLLVDISRLCVSLLLNCLQFGSLPTMHLLNRAVFWWKLAIRERKGNSDSDAREF